METTEQIWMDGEFIPWKQATTHVLTHTLHYGAGVFEGIRFYDTEDGAAIFRLRDHIVRLFHSADAIHMQIPYSIDAIVAATKELIKRNGITSGYIRPIAFYGYGKMGLNPGGAPVNIAVACWPWPAYLGDRPIRVKTSKYIRIHPKSSETQAKICGHYVNSIMASLDIHRQGYDEGLLLDFEGNVAEGPGENIFIIRHGRLMTPKSGNILPGITRDSIKTIAEENGIIFEETTLTLEDIYQAEEALFVGTAAEVTAIASVDDNALEKVPGPITSKLKAQYLDIVHGKTRKYEKWLTYVKSSGHHR